MFWIISASIRVNGIAQSVTQRVEGKDGKQHEADGRQNPRVRTDHAEGSGVLQHQPPGDQRRLYRKAKEAKEKLDGGADFEEIAKEYGKDGSAASGGLLGDYAYDTTELGSDFMAEVKKLAEGEISAPVKTSFGWHIIKVTDIRKDSSVKPLEEVKATISETLLNNKQQEKIASTLDAWEKEYNVQRFPDLIKQDSVPLPAPLEVPQTSTTPGTTGAQNTTGTQGATTPASSN